MTPYTYTLLLTGAVLLCAAYTTAEKTNVPCWRNSLCDSCPDKGQQNSDMVCCQGCASAPMTIRGGSVCTCLMEPSSATNWAQSFTRITGATFVVLTSVMLLTR